MEAIMLGNFRAIKIGLAVIVAAVVALGEPSCSYARTGSVRITVAKAGFIVGVGGGKGTLHFRGKSYPLSIGGVSVGTIGVAGADLVGRVYNLRSAADIAGTYTAASGSIAVAGGAKVARLQNANGVVRGYGLAGNTSWLRGVPLLERHVRIFALTATPRNQGDPHSIKCWSKS
jgi:hypothetical protein